MRVACVTFRLYLIKGVYVGHLQWDSMRKAPTAWANSYVAGVLEIGGTIFARDGKKITYTSCPTRGPWFGKFMWLYKIQMRFIKKNDF